MKINIFPKYDIVLSKSESRQSSYDYDDDYDDDYERQSYSKYGGYNGFDDETIDSAFEGMPEATWNID